MIQDVLRNTAQVLSSLQGSAAIMGGDRLLGNAGFDAWCELRNQLNLFGYPTADEHEQALAEYLRDHKEELLAWLEDTNKTVEATFEAE